jgi:hypothetical protein
MKPGNLIEWVYKRNSQPVDENEQLWSTSMKRWIQIGVRPAVLISINDEFYVWLNPNGLFHALVDDTFSSPARARMPRVVPRVVGEHR